MSSVMLWWQLCVHAVGLLPGFPDFLLGLLPLHLLPTLLHCSVQCIYWCRQIYKVQLSCRIHIDISVQGISHLVLCTSQIHIICTLHFGLGGFVLLSLDPDWLQLLCLFPYLPSWFNNFISSFHFIAYIHQLGEMSSSTMFSSWFCWKFL